MAEVNVNRHEEFLRQAVELALDNVQQRQGRPFGAVLVSEGNVVATGVNEVGDSGDPTAHAEIEAIRAAARSTGQTMFSGHTMYASGHPCPMCLAAMYLVGIQTVYFAYSLEEGEPYGLTTRPIYDQLAKPLDQQAISMVHLPVRSERGDVYAIWHEREG